MNQSSPLPMGSPEDPQEPTESLRYTPRDALSAFNKGEGSAPIPRDQYGTFEQDTYEVNGIKLSPDQIAAEKQIMGEPGRVRILTGRAGSGKSLLIQYLRQRYGLTVSAMTGKAAVNVDGVTAHGLFAYYEGACFSEGFRYKMMTGSTRDIIVDEASMCGQKMADYLHTVITQFDKRLIFVGDWAQAAPVKDYWPFGTQLWTEARVVRLTECHRQHDRSFVDALDQARYGQLSPQAADLFRSRVNPAIGDQPGVVRMYAVNAMTEEWNTYKLRKHVDENHVTPFQLNALFVDQRSDKEMRNSPRNQKFIEKAIEESRLAHESVFALGAQVVVMKNAKGEYDATDDSIYKQYVNGDTGAISGALDMHGEQVDLSDPRRHIQISYIEVKRYRDGKVIRVPRVLCETKDIDKKVIHSVTGFPIQLAWAMSTHKCIDIHQLVPTVGGMSYAQDLAKEAVPGSSFVELKRPIAVAGSDGARSITHAWRGAAEADGYRIVTTSGYALICGTTHRLLNDKGDWIPSDSLRPGDSLTLRMGPFETLSGTRPKVSTSFYNSSKRALRFPLEVDDDLGYFLGVAVGDSSHSDTVEGRMEIADSHRCMVQWCADYVERSFGIKVKWFKRNGFYFHSVDVREALNSLGLGFTKARAADIPHSVIRSPASVMTSFLRGLFDADGGVNANSVHLTTASQLLADQVQQVLLSMYGIRSCQSAVGASRRISIGSRNIKLFHTSVGFGIPVKHSAAGKLAARSGLLKIPKSSIGQLPDCLNIRVPLRDMLLRQYAKKYGSSCRLESPGEDSRWADLVSGVAKGTRNINYDHIRELMLLYPKAEWGSSDNEQLRYVSRIASAGGFIQKIHSISRVRSTMVDFTVTEDHSYVTGGGFINHNCQGMTVDNAWFDMASVMRFPPQGRHGLAYVGLSRARTSEGLYLGSFVPEAIHCDAVTRPWL